MLDNRKMVKHVKHINLKLFFTYNKKENLRKVVRERGNFESLVCAIIFTLRLECECGSYVVGVWTFTLSYGFVGKMWLVPLNLKRGFYIKLWKLCFGSVFSCLDKRLAFF